MLCKDIVNHFKELFPDQINQFYEYIVQRYNQEWSCWLDCDCEKEVTIINQMQLKLIRKESDVITFFVAYIYRLYSILFSSL